MEKLKSQFRKEYFADAKINGMKIELHTFINLENELYIEWLEKHAVIHDNEYSSALRIAKEWSEDSKGQIFSEYCLDHINKNFNKDSE